MSANPFDYINDISFNKKDIIRNSPNEDLAERGYNPWLTNKSLSYYQDCLFYANEMNKNPHLTNRQQYDYFLNSINKKKRFAKQSKKTVSEDVNVVAKFFGYSIRRAEEALSILTAKQLQIIKLKLETGGT